jgi:ectoine hydroxylase-related dioxygenase (phytanoyl-CoA dioxygenase family)
MLKTAHNIRRLDPWLRSVIVLYFVSAMCLVAAHQHSGALQSHDCALCAVAQTPASVVSVAPHPDVPAPTGFLLPIPSAHRWDSEPRSTSRTRAPPIA